MWLEILHPQVARRSCQHCQRWLYDETTGQRQTIPGTDVPEKRDDPNTTPCRTERGCPKGTPEAPRSLNERNQQVYEHYLQCKAVGSFPDDPLVRANAAIIMQTEKEAERELLIRGIDVAVRARVAQNRR